MPVDLLSPEVAFVLLAVAALGVVLEVAVPGVGLGALTAVLLLGLSGWALAGLSPRPLGLLLALLAAVLLVLGVFVRGRVLWCAAAGVALVAAGRTLFTEPLGAELLVPVAVAVPLAASVLGRVVARVWAVPAHRGVAGTLVGLKGVVRDGAEGGEPLLVHVAGALWKARADEPLRESDAVVVLAQEDLELRVAAAGGREGRDDASR